MISIIKNLSKTAIAVIAVSIAFTSCTKDNSDSSKPLTATNQSATVTGITTTLLTGNYGSPTPAPGVYGTKYLNIATGAQDSTGTITYHLTFTSTNNLAIAPKAGAGYTFKYLNTTKSLATVNNADYTAATTVATGSTLNLNTLTDSLNTGLGANGWLNYNSTTHAVNYTHNIVLFIRVGTTTYAFQCYAAAGQGTATLNRGRYWFRRGTLIN
ncbi:hypothetical protein [Mucilaginibacter lappiensis]|uniref:hypothetical protein n=1 Tax=Mucilaginibacter lappiensis TaxID=354630 RepID=UPI003D25AF4F